MNAFGFTMVILSVLAQVTGQVWLKQAMDPSRIASPRWKAITFSGAIAALALSFFVSLGLLQKYDLSYYYPFQGLSVVMVTVAACLFLKERITLQLSAGMILISLGVILVSSS